MSGHFFKETTVLVFPGIFTFSFFSSWFFLMDCSRFCQYDTCFSQKREAIWQGMFKNGQKTNGIKKPSFYPRWGVQTRHGGIFERFGSIPRDDRNYHLGPKNQTHQNRAWRFHHSTPENFIPLKNRLCTTCHGSKRIEQSQS